MKTLHVSSLEPYLRDINSWAALAGLIETMRQGRVMPFLGAGVSQAIGFPGWQETVARLGQAARRQQQASPEDADAQAAPWPSGDDPLALADRYREMMASKEHYEQFFHDHFRCTAEQHLTIKSSRLWQALARIPCRCWLTLNYDQVLETALREHGGRKAVAVDWGDRSPINSLLLGENPAEIVSCIHLHGVVSESGQEMSGCQFIFTEEEYQQRYLRSDEDRSKLFILFTSNVIVFIGCSLTDLDLMGVLREVKAKLGFRGHRHYALLSMPSGDPEQATGQRWRFRIKYGIEPIFYDNSAGDFQGLPVLLEFIHAALECEQAAVAVPDTILTAIKDDPQKGRWGMTAARDSFRLSISHSLLRGDMFSLTIRVRGPGRSARIHAHPSLGSMPERSFYDHEVAWQLQAWGAFTIGVEVTTSSDETIWLELDLAECMELPYSFRSL